MYYANNALRKLDLLFVLHKTCWRTHPQAT